MPASIGLPTLGAGKVFHARVTPPGSKSLSNRALLLAGLAGGASVVRGLARGSEDVERMVGAVRALGARVEEDGAGTVRVEGVGGRWRVRGEGARLDLGNAGTCVRFLAAAAMFAPAPVTIDGDGRMRERPIGELGDALVKLGCRVEYGGERGFPPLTVHPRDAAGAPPPVVELGSTRSGQFISALLLCAPFLPGGLTLRLLTDATSQSYVAMTLGLLGRVGATVKASDNLRVMRVAGGARGLAGFEYGVEPDASGATYFWGAAAATPGGRVGVLGLDEHSLQGDCRFPEVLARMGAQVTRSEESGGAIEVKGPPQLRPIFADMGDMPDAALTLAAVACFAQGASIIRGLRTLRDKETDRVAALRSELAKIGVRVENPVNGDPDTITITPPHRGVECSAECPAVEFETYGDHRVAMSLAIIGLRRANTTLKNPACVAKTYPAFWGDWARLFE